MLKDFVLGTEIANKGKFTINNISIAINAFNLVEGRDYLKFGGITLLSKECTFLPHYIYKNMFGDGITDLTDLLPYTYFMDEVEKTTTLIKNKYTLVDVSGKKFVKITDKELYNAFFKKRLTRYVVHSSEMPELINGRYIDGFIKLSSSKVLTWYE